MNKFFHLFFSIASDTECNGHTHNSSQSYYWLLMLWVFCVWLMALRYLRAHVGGMCAATPHRRRVEDDADELFFLQAITFLPRYASLSRETTHNYQIPLKYLKYLSPAKSSFRTLTGTPQELDAESMTCDERSLEHGLSHVKSTFHIISYSWFSRLYTHNSLHSKKLSTDLRYTFSGWSVPSDSWNTSCIDDVSRVQ